ncbi:MAG: hypothetical protein E6G56_10690 [Actinobacteria bacterium]|nr:MAG: hypothetical protein E6G56_10690 [Actinomycetota bacterium]
MLVPVSAPSPGDPQPAPSSDRADSVRTRILARALRVDRQGLAVATGLRNAAFIGAVLAAGVATGHVKVGLGLAGGAIFAGFADLGGSYGARLRSMGLATAAAALSAWVGTVTGSSDVAAVALMGAWGVGAGLLAALGMEASFIGIQAALGLLLASAFPAGAEEALVRSAMVLAGGGGLTLIAVGLWPFRPAGPQRDAAAGVYRLLADHVADPQPSGFARARIAAGQLLADTVGRAGPHTELGEALQGALDQVDRIYGELVALEQLQDEADRRPRLDAALDALRRATAGCLRACAVQLAAGRTSGPDREALAAAHDAAERLGAGAHAESPPDARRLAMAEHAIALCGQLRAAEELSRARVGHGRPRAAGGWVALRRFATLGSRSPLAVLRANLDWGSPAMRHGLRLGVALAAGVALARGFGIPHGYWVPLTVIFVLRPDYGETFSRGAQRYAGTVLGAGVATLLAAAIVPGGYALAALVALMAWGMFAFFYANYALFTASITAMIVFLVAFSAVSPYVAVLNRLEATAIGAALAMAAYALWPTWERKTARETVARLLADQRDYARAVLGGVVAPAAFDAPAIRRARMASRLARTNAEASLERLAADPASQRRDAGRFIGLLASTRRTAAALLALEACLQDGAMRPTPELEPLARQVDEAMARLVHAAREPARGDQEIALPALRATQRRLVDAVGPGEVARETDRLVDALDTLAHVLGARARPVAAPAAGASVALPRLSSSGR